MSRWKVFSLGLDERHGDGLCVRVDLDAQGVIHPAFGLLAGLPIDNLNGPGGLFAANKVFRPTTNVNRGVNQLSASVRLVQGHSCRLLCVER